MTTPSLQVSADERTFRQRALVLLLVVGLLPTLGLGLLGRWALSEVLSVSFAPLESLLERVEPALSAAPLQEELSEARLFLAQAELARGALVRRAPSAFLAVLLFVGLLCAGLAWAMGRRLARPLEQLAASMGRFSRGERDVRLLPDPRSPRELLGLVRQFNQMVDELLAQRERLRQAEQLAAWQEVARELAHELKNPLTAMKMALGRLQRVDGSPQGRARLEESLSLLHDELELLSRMTQSFSLFARLPAPTFAPLELSRVLRDVCALFEQGAPVPVRLDAPGPVWTSGDVDQLKSAFSNLLKNATEAEGTGAVRVRLSEEGARARVEIFNGGVGVRSRLDGAALTRGLATTKSTGAGLGLPISAKVVLAHQGELWLEPGAEGGTRAVVLLPRAEAGR